MFYRLLPELSRTKTRSLADLLPWSRVVDHGVVRCKDGTLLCGFALRGHDLEASDGDEVRSRLALLNQALMGLGSGWGMWVESRRSRITPPEPDFMQGFPASQIIELERTDAARELFMTDSTLYLSFTPPTANQPIGLTTGWFDWLLESSDAQLSQRIKTTIQGLFGREARPDRDNAAVQEATDRLARLLRDEVLLFKQQVSLLRDAMAHSFARLEPLDTDALLAGLKSTCSTYYQPVRAENVTNGYLHEALGTQRLAAGFGLSLGGEHVHVLSVKGFGASTRALMLQAINACGFEVRWVTRWLALSTAEARSILDRKEQLFAQRSEKLSNQVTNQASGRVDRSKVAAANEAGEVLCDVDRQHYAVGYVSQMVIVSSPDPDEARARARLVRELLVERGLLVVNEGRDPKSPPGTLGAWLSAMPGHVRPNPRRQLVKTTNLCHILPTSGLWAGSQRNTHIGGPAHLLCSVQSTTPFWCNLNVGDVGHTFIVGPTGAGKSVLLGMLMANWFRYPDAQVVCFDKGRSSRVLCQLNGGHFWEPGRAGAPGLRPFTNVNDPSERAFLTEWLASIAELNQCRVTASQRDALIKALEGLGAMSPTHRRMATLLNLIQDKPLRQALAQYAQGESTLWGDLFDAHDEHISRSPMLCIETSELMEKGDRVIAPALDYLFHRLDARFDGRPTLLVLDEAWTFLEHSSFAKRIKTWLKELRKRNVYVIFATQSVEDVTSSPISASVLDNVATQILLPNAKARNEQTGRAYHLLGLSPDERRMLALLTPKQHYYMRNANGQRIFGLGLTPGSPSLAILGASRQEDQKRLDVILAHHRDPKARLEAWFGTAPGQ